MSGKKKENTIKFTQVAGASGRTLRARYFRPGRMHDQTAVKSDGIARLLKDHADVDFEMDGGYRGLAPDHCDNVTCPKEAQLRGHR